MDLDGHRRQPHGTASVFRAARDLPLHCGRWTAPADRYATTVQGVRMPGAGVGDAHVHRLADLVCDAIVASTERLLVAGGKALFTVFDVGGTPRIELTSTASVLPTAADGQG